MSGLQKNNTWKSKSTVPMFHREDAVNATVSKPETLGCSQSPPSSRLQEASCAPAVLRAEEWGLWWHVTDRKWGGGKSEGDRGAGQWREEKTCWSQDPHKTVTQNILNPKRVWKTFAKGIAEYTTFYIRERSFSLWANRFENWRNGSFCPICVPITDKWAKHPDNESRNISNCYSLN